MAQTFSFDQYGNRIPYRKVVSSIELDAGRLKHGRKNAMPASEMKDVLIFTDDTAELYIGQGGNLPIKRVTDTVVFDSVSDLPIPGVGQRLYITKDSNNLFYWDGITYQVIGASASGDAIKITPQVYCFSDLDEFPKIGASPALYIAENTEKVYRFGADGKYHELGAPASTNGLIARIQTNERAIKTLQQSKADKADLETKADKYMLASKAEKAELAKKADASVLDGKADRADLDKYIPVGTKIQMADLAGDVLTAINAKTPGEESAGITQADLDKKADKTELASKADVSALEKKADWEALEKKADAIALIAKADRTELVKYRLLNAPIEESDLSASLQAKIKAMQGDGSAVTSDDTAIKERLAAVEGDYAKLSYSEATYMKKSDTVDGSQLPKEIREALGKLPILEDSLHSLTNQIPKMQAEIDELTKRIKILEAKKDDSKPLPDPSDNPNEPKKTDILALYEIETRPVQLGTTAAELGLPESVEATMADGSVKKAAVVWQTGTYDSAKVGQQVIKGTIVETDEITNGKKIVPCVTITVSNPETSEWEYEFKLTTPSAGLSIPLDSIQKGLRFDEEDFYAHPALVKVQYIGTEPTRKYEQAPIDVPTDIDVDDGATLHSALMDGCVSFNSMSAEDQGGAISFSGGSLGVRVYKLVRRNATKA